MTIVTALLEVPTYTKALHRRATSNDSLGTWTSLSAADKGLDLPPRLPARLRQLIHPFLDYRQLLEILPSSSPLLPSIRTALNTLGPRLEKAQKAETDEMVDKLKDLGNSVLGA